ncbi:probable phosphatase phospho1 [Trichomycterus rosablanca]|uniref:probable phosphatase phospho1 n=1 Tax=Trichomycterus rosablanca TaxID=2290929 RepID=UPI002F353365
MCSRFLFCFDFDDTLIDENSDYSVVRAAPLHTLPSNLSDSFSPGYFLEHSQRILTFLHECGVTEENIQDEIEKIPASPGGRTLLDFLFAAGDFECIILSDSNAYFIDTWLRKAGFWTFFSKVFTNPAEFDADGRLVLRPLHSHSCSKCPKNLCKQVILREYLDKRTKERGEPFQKVFFIGDGANDICPTLALGKNDVVFPRNGFPMHTIIQEMQTEQPGVYKAAVVPWKRGEDVVDFLKKLLKEK